MTFGDFRYLGVEFWIELFIYFLDYAYDDTYTHHARTQNYLSIVFRF